MTTTGKNGAGQTTVVAAFDNVSFRLTAFPEPGALLLTAGGVAGLLRRRRGR